MRYASVDIGTNTLRLLIGEFDSDGNLKRHFSDTVITRLGGGYTKEAGIAKDSAERAFKALSGFKKEIENYGVAEVFAAATSAVRRAANQEWFLSEGSKRLGASIRVIDGDEEARFSLKGVASVIPDPKLLVMDIGGGSTEFIATEAGEVKGAWSLELGVVHLTETYLWSDPPGSGELAVLWEEIISNLAGLKQRMLTEGVMPEDYTEGAKSLFVGTAGTVTTLAAVDLGIEEYDPDVINNHILTRASLEEIFNRLLGMTLKERAEVAMIEKGREDLIVAGAAITLAAMGEFAFDNIVVSDSGLLEGLLIDGAGKV